MLRQNRKRRKAQKKTDIFHCRFAIFFWGIILSGRTPGGAVFMPPQLRNRIDLLNIFNSARFFVRHFACGYYPTNSGMISSPMNRLFFPLRNPNGEKNYIFDGKERHILEPCRMYFVPAYFPAQYCLDDDLYFFSLHTNLEIFPGVELFSNCNYMLNIPCPPEFGEFLAFFDRSPENAYFDALKVGSLGLSAIVRVLEFYKLEDFASPLSLKKFSPLSDYLNRNATARTSVAELADLCGLTRESFTRKFTAAVGITPKKLIDRFVVKRCIELLDQGCRLKEISFQLQFSDEFVFSRYFKRITGVSPRDWLRNHKKSG